MKAIIKTILQMIFLLMPYVLLGILVEYLALADIIKHNEIVNVILIGAILGLVALFISFCIFIETHEKGTESIEKIVKEFQEVKEEENKDFK